MRDLVKQLVILLLCLVLFASLLGCAKRDRGPLDDANFDGVRDSVNDSIGSSLDGVIDTNSFNITVPDWNSPSSGDTNTQPQEAPSPASPATPDAVEPE